VFSLAFNGLQDIRTELLSNLAKGEYTPPNRLTIRDFATDQWLPSIEALVAGNEGPSTAAGTGHR
jgi:hypothetical protein